ncbi:MAG: transcription-repair coupling factor [Chlorobiaceae bacterium]|nr:transcription-repair coupling factor [Chlorobiaceae bacterium]NTV60337.1 transcription-repair coupling factor [Chlorobiaceae bacterium]
MKTLSDAPAVTAAMTRRNTAFLFDLLTGSEPYETVRKALQTSLPDGGASFAPLDVTGLQGSLAPLLAASLYRESKTPLMVLCGQNSFELYENDLDSLLPDAGICNTSDGLSLSLLALTDKKSTILLSLFDDLDRGLCDPDQAGKRIFRLSVNRDAGYENLKRFLTSNGFESREFVEDEGEYSLRGAIIDVFPFGAAEPLRIEFFGDTVSSLRIFDINSQLSGKTLQNADLTAGFSESGSASTILDYLDPSTVILIDDIAELSSLDNHDALSAALARFRRIVVLPSSPSAVTFNALPQKKLNANFRLLASLIQQQASADKRTVIATASQREARELGDFLSDETAGSGKGSMPETWWVPLNLYEGFTFGDIDLYTESDIFGKLHSHKSHRKRKIRGISLKDLHRLKIGDYVVHEDYGIGIFRSLETICVGNSDQETVLIEYEGGDQLYVNIQNINLLSKYSAAESSSPTLSKLGSSKWSAKKDKVRRKLRDIAINLIKVYAQRKMQPGFAFGPDSIFMREFEASFIFDETPDQLKAIEEVKKDMQASNPMDRLICGDAGFGKTEIAMRAAFKAVESKKQVAILTPTTILAHQHYESFTRRFENFPVTIAVLSRFVPRREQQELLKKIEAGMIDIVIGTHRLVSKDVRFRELGLLVIDEEQHFGVEVKEKLREQFPNVDTLTMSATPIPRTLQFSMLGARDLSIVSTPPKNRQPVETIITDYDASLIESAIRREIQRDGQVFFLHNRISSIEETLRSLRELVPSARMVYAHGQLPPRELEKIMMDFMQKEVDVLISTTIIGSGLDISNANTIFINRADMFGLSDLYQLRGRVGRSDRKAYCYLMAPPLHTLKREAVQRLAVIESFTELGSGFNIALRDLDIRGAGNLLGAEQSGYIHELGFDLYQKMLEETVAELKSTEFSHLFESDGKTPAAPAKSCDLVFFFNALIPDYYISATHERFTFYEKISKAASDELLDTLSGELRDRFGPIPEEVTNLLLLSKFKLACTALGLEKIDLQPGTLSLFLPDQESGNLQRREFYQYLFTAVQEPWMQEFRPGFRFEKKMKLVLNHPEGINDPEKLLPLYLELLKKLDAAAKETITEHSL